MPSVTASIAVLGLLVSLAAPPSRPAPGPKAASRLDSLAWMAGSWVSDSAGTRSEEHWIAPSGGLMVGMNRLVIGGRARAFDFMRIREMGDTIVYLAQPSGRPPTPFALIELGGKRVMFENRAHDFPQRILYWLADDGSLKARVEGTIQGREQYEEYAWRPGALTP
ncbi:MAG TPA: DUF6265 family protein, partial [Candidatus Eisenbacteria bacterium]|nr:DUF6265 family protein [Candidatus Eisenbacteria bacterium]